MSSPPVRRRGPEWWFYVLSCFVALQVAFYTVPHTRPAEVGALMWMLGQDTLAWTVVVGALGLAAFFRASSAGRSSPAGGPSRSS